MAVLLAVGLAACGGGSPLSPAPSVVVPTPTTPTPAPAELRPVIDALFMGSGRLSPRDGVSSCMYFPGYWAAFPRGTTVRVKVSTTVGADALAAVRAAAAQVPSATLGSIQAMVEIVNDPLPRPGDGEVTVTTHADPIAQGCPSSVGCTIGTFGALPATLSGARAILPPNQTPNAFAHDVVGHGILGMCHIDGALGGGPQNSLMSGGPGVFSDQIAIQLTERDLRAAQAVYAAALQPGAQRGDFVAAGLVDP